MVIERILNCHEAYAGAVLVHDSMIKQAVYGKPRLHPEAAFPFAGMTTLRVRMKAMRTPAEKGWRFIVFTQEHCSGAFPFSAISCDRDNSNLRPEEGKSQPNEQKAAAFLSKQPSGRDVVKGELQSEDEPSKYIPSAVVTLPEDRFEALAGIVLEKPEKKMCHYFSACAIQPLALPTDTLSTGDGAYSVSGVTPTSMEVNLAHQEAFPPIFDNVQAMVIHLNGLNGSEVRIRPGTEVIAYIPLTKPYAA